eukprot:TRINITY_DN33472_c0_g1_i1.p1 TRINITY_DN33472_c0_g1~~TRINITY_DN33472_c0_g1_i1.p1  ORF type:complete len:406 (+),score=187.31 TRINITY_DN33472_c0_g1_i1:61-1278(+)
MRSSRMSRQVRGIAGVAPVLHFPSVAPAADQKAVNTAKALAMIRAQLGEKPAPYTRKYNTSFNQLKSEIDTILAACGTQGSPLVDGQELTQMQVIERVLRHGLCSFAKNEGTCSYEDMEKWLVYTAADQMNFNKLKKEAEHKEKYDAFKATHPNNTLPELDWAKEYAATIDREIVAEKRLRYDEIANTSFERDEAAVEAELKAYKQPVQDALLDSLVDQVNMFRPFLAKQVIQAKLIERNMDGQLTFSRFADWNPDARDAAELNFETHPEVYGTAEDLLGLSDTLKRYAEVRMRTKEEVLETMDGAQQAAMAKIGGDASMGAAEARRAQLLAEIIRMQSRVAGTDDTAKDSTESQEDKEAKAEAARLAKEAEMAKFRVSDAVVKQKGLLGLNFISADPVPKAASA